jgi:plastocyanin domain-containing protein
VTPADWAVLAAGVASIAWVNWYFFLGERGTVVAAVAADVTITVKGGYTPAVVRVKAGQPVRLVFDRQERSGCSEEIVFPDFGIKKFLPAFQTTTVEVTPPAPGTYEFTCGMSMLRGRLIAD